jgi:hydrogenase maturation factor
MCLGTLGVIARVWEEDGLPMALVDDGSRTRAACLLGRPGAGVGARVLVHLGFVVEVLDGDLADDAARLRAGGEGLA